MNANKIGEHFQETARSKNLVQPFFGRKCCRVNIYTQLEKGITPVAIAMGLNRSASTGSRKLRRIARRSVDLTVSNSER